VARAVNTGCMPTKTLIASAYAAHVRSRAIDYGVVLEGRSESTWAGQSPRRRRGCELTKQHREWLRSIAGCTVIKGHARFEEPHTLRVGEELFSAPRISSMSEGVLSYPTCRGRNGPVSPNSSILALDRVPSTW